MIEIIEISVNFLSKLRGRSVMLYPSSCHFREGLNSLPYDYIILNNKEISDLYHKPGSIQLIGNKIITIPYDNERTLRLLIDAGIKISCFVGIQDGCVDGGNHECVNSFTFFSRLSPILPETSLYITNHYFTKGSPLKRKIPFSFLRQKPGALSFNPLLLSDYCEGLDEIFVFKVKKTDPFTITHKVGKINVSVHHLSIWEMANMMHGIIIPDYPIKVNNNFLDPETRQKCLSQARGYSDMLNWALKNKYRTIGSVPFMSDSIMSDTILRKIKCWNVSYPRDIHFFHLLKSEMDLFRKALIGMELVK